MESSKPRLFFFGDSFVQWHAPSPGHWTERFADKYRVHKLGASGVSNSGILHQFSNLPDYIEGDRLVVVLTSPYRLPVWMYTDDNMEWEDKVYRNSFIKEAIKEVRDYFSLKLYDILNFNPKTSNIITSENPFQVYDMLGLMYKIFINYRPVFVTWSKDTYKLFPIATYIEPSSYSTVSDEKIQTEFIDHHPGIEGGKVWYSTINELLNNWVKREYSPYVTGSPGVKVTKTKSI